MTTRNAKQAASERAIFDAFLRAYPSFAATVKRPPDQPDAQFPDVIVTLADGSQIDFELGEWLHEEQMRQGKRRGQMATAMATAIEQAIGEQGENASEHFRFVMLMLRPDGPRFQSADEKDFRAEIWRLIEETERRWPNEPDWHDPQGLHVRDFSTYPALAQYLSLILFSPLIVGQSRREQYPAHAPWIVVDLPGGAYTPNTALDALENIFQEKIAHYGPLSRTTNLLVFFNQAILYNTPWHGVGVGKFGDVAAAAVQMVTGQSRFARIYLLSAVEPDLEAYEIFPSLAKCE